MILFYNVFNSFFVLNETYNTNKKNMSEISKKKKKNKETIQWKHSCFMKNV